MYCVPLNWETFTRRHFGFIVKIQYLPAKWLDWNWLCSCHIDQTHIHHSLFSCHIHDEQSTNPPLNNYMKKIFVFLKIEKARPNSGLKQQKKQNGGVCLNCFSYLLMVFTAVSFYCNRHIFAWINYELRVSGFPFVRFGCRRLRLARFFSTISRKYNVKIQKNPLIIISLDCEIFLFSLSSFWFSSFSSLCLKHWCFNPEKFSYYSNKNIDSLMLFLHLTFFINQPLPFARDPGIVESMMNQFYYSHKILRFAAFFLPFIPFCLCCVRQILVVFCSFCTVSK